MSLLDKQPYTGTKDVTGRLRIKTDSYLKEFFDNTPNVDQVKHVTMGKIYNVIRFEGYGDCEDVTFIDDAGEEHTLGSFFFEEITE